MTWTRRSCFSATYALVWLFFGVSRASAWGALAVGVSPDYLQAVTSPVVGKASEDEARETALAACRTAKGGADQARSLCTVVGTFRNQCFATAGPGWSIAADEEAARIEAVAKCRSSPCTLKTGPCPPVTISARCKVNSSGCDGEAGPHIRAPGAQTASNQEAVAAAKELVSTMRLTDQFTMMLPVIVKNLKPAILQGRPEIEKDFDAVTTVLLEGMTPRLNEMTDQIAGLYGRTFTVSELRQLTEFYRTPVGQKFLDKTPVLAQQSMTIGQNFGRTIAGELQGKIMEELRKRGHNNLPETR
jgi:uncharacterized protein